uniref:uncharacterized protein LOC100179220 isoform X2 n=1 Tax=Ciona intestinalis TaxID=7719 RepID=UPI00089DB3C8|nr:uncharacterized protein LOC100179220 isoform X2 [Ciona intestinalis]|eukprot:XP_018666733.1 uncharacterized protein LOC100179220 isoform X2 [Ciona intestinalis]
MAVRPKTTFSSVNETVEDVSCGCVMHRIKGGYKRKRVSRWGQLRFTVDKSTDTALCIIRLFKHDITSSAYEPSRGKEPKLKFELKFTKQDFCGIEKGEHYDRHGMRRYLCIITKEKHLIIEDAVMTAAGINHNVLGTWYQLIAETMEYVNRWRIVENNPKLAKKICYLHVSVENTCECHSLEDKTRENRNCLVLRSWPTHMMQQIHESVEIRDGVSFTDLTFHVPDDLGNLSRVNLSVEGTPNVRQLVEKLKRTNGHAPRAKTTLCPGFDDLNCSPNLIRIPRQNPPKGIRGMLTKTISGKNNQQGNLDMQKAKKMQQNSPANVYVSLENQSPEPDSNSSPTEQQYCNLPPKEASSPHSQNRDHNHSGSQCDHDSNPRILVASNSDNLFQPSPQDINPYINHQPAPRLPPSDPFDPPHPRHRPRTPSFDDDFKKGPALATQTSFDSDYQTGNFSTSLTSTDLDNRYVNLQQNNSDHHSSPEPPTSNQIYRNLSSEDNPPAVPARDVERMSQNQPYINLSHRLSLPLMDERSPDHRLSLANQPPPRPPKQSMTTERNREHVREHVRAPPIPGRQFDERYQQQGRVDLVASSIERGTLPPLNLEEDRRAYENSTAFEVTINEVLQGTHWNSRDRWLNLPHALFVKLALGLENDSTTVADWKVLAEQLGLSFKHIQQLLSLSRSHANIRPLEVLLLHWSRTQSPVPLTLPNLKDVLLKIGRADLVELLNTAFI